MVRKNFRKAHLILFILFNASLLGCFEIKDWDKDEEVTNVLNASISYMSRDEERRGGIIDSILVLCQNPIIIMDSLWGQAGSRLCNVTLYSDPRVRIIDQWPDIETRMKREVVSRLYFYQFDTIYIGIETLATRGKWKTIGSSNEVKCVFNRKTLEFLERKHLEMIQY